MLKFRTPPSVWWLARLKLYRRNACQWEKSQMEQRRKLELSGTVVRQGPGYIPVWCAWKTSKWRFPYPILIKCLIGLPQRRSSTSSPKGQPVLNPLQLFVSRTSFFQASSVPRDHKWRLELEFHLSLRPGQRSPALTLHHMWTRLPETWSPLIGAETYPWNCCPHFLSNLEELIPSPFCTFCTTFNSLPEWVWLHHICPMWLDAVHECYKQVQRQVGGCLIWEPWGLVSAFCRCGSVGVFRRWPSSCAEVLCSREWSSWVFLSCRTGGINAKMLQYHCSVFLQIAVERTGFLAKL